MSDTTIRQNSIHAWILAARPKTLSGAAVPVLIGLSLAYIDSLQYGYDVFSWTAAVLCMLFALVMQIDANFVNDFFDYARGNDDSATRLGPLRACTQGWVSLSAMKKAIATTTCLACVIGLPLIYYGGLEMVIVGLCCVVFCFLYTTHLSYLGMGDLLVLLFFGIVPVCITYYVQLHTVTSQVFIASIACGLVIDGLLIVNNYRDRENDRRDGKKTLVVHLGEKTTEWLYLAIGIVAALLGVVFWTNGHIIAFILPLIYLVLHIFTWLKMRRIRQGRQLNECLGETARNILIYGLTVSAGLLLL
ncbi:MAG: 1,4-dihydroxy-2-naphthoate octaprenyltransferase [Prevotella sp.]|nr:1,4-dihydroxy-2-naphthoate octaprenyltransferase [Prevotella sp.]